MFRDKWKNIIANFFETHTNECEKRSARKQDVSHGDVNNFPFIMRSRVDTM